jgi:serine/threonine-protein kinase
MAEVEEPRIVGRYTLHGEIASGGMATVYFGRLMGQAGFSRVVAIKRLHPQFVRDEDFRAMFLDEARVCARVRHPNVVSILDVVELEGELCLVMEYVQGETFSRLMRTARLAQNGIAVEMVAGIVSGVLDGLHAAHEARSERGEPLGIVHRDVSPQNIMVGVDGVARVVDFGVAKATGRLQTTRDGQLKGKLSYMAPEQIRGGVVDRRTDIYSASVVLWEALAGRRLFDGDHDAVVYGKVLESPVAPPSQYAAGIGAALDAIVLRGLARDPESRFPTALEMAVAIEGAVPLASARQIGRKVQYLAEATLLRRAERFAEIENISSIDQKHAQSALMPAAASSAPSASTWAHSIGSGGSAAQSADPARPPVPSNPALAAEAAGPQSLDPRSVSQLTNLSMSGHGRISRAPRSRARLMAAVIGGASAGLLLLVGLLVAVSWRQHSLLGGDTTTSAPANDTSAPVPIGPDRSDVPPIAPPIAQTLVVPDSSASAAPAPSGQRAPTKRAAQPAPAKSSGAKGPAGANDCNPPYTLDAKGTRIPKIHCL